jgi:hypothetical protein
MRQGLTLRLIASLRGSLSLIGAKAGNFSLLGYFRDTIPLSSLVE